METRKLALCEYLSFGFISPGIAYAGMIGKETISFGVYTAPAYFSYNIYIPITQNSFTFGNKKIEILNYTSDTVEIRY